MARKWVHKPQVWTIFRLKRSKAPCGLENPGFRAPGGLQMAVFAENRQNRDFLPKPLAKTSPC